MALYGAPAGSIFTTVKVKELGREDFYIGSRTPTMLKFSGCAIILFYIPTDPVSYAMQQIWAQLASTLAGISFFAINCSVQDEIVAAFKETGSDVDHPLYPFRIEGIPQIMVYRGGWPQAYYNGELSYDALQNYALTLACKPGYYEPESDYVGVGRTLLDAQGEYDLVVPDERVFGAQVPPTSRNYFIPINNEEEQTVTVGDDMDDANTADDGGPDGSVDEDVSDTEPYKSQVTTYYVEDNV